MRRAKTGPDWATPWKARMCFGGMVGSYLGEDHIMMDEI